MIPKEDSSEEVFRSISKQEEGLGTLEGCCLHYDTNKKKWIGSGNTLGVGNKA